MKSQDAHHEGTEAQRRRIVYDQDGIQLWHGDALDCLREMSAQSVNCCVTSPPYWNLRNYDVKGQIGLEDTPEAYIERLVEVFRDVRRVLRDDGTLWLNIGDSYSGGSRGNYDTKSSNKGNTASRGLGRTSPPGLKPKDICMVPARIAMALQADGWYLRCDIIWFKPNPMPESVTDRPTKSHEYLFLLSKSPRYYYDAYSIREPLADKTLSTFGTVRNPNGGGNLVKSDRLAKTMPVRKPKQWKTPDGWDTSKGEGGHGSIHRKGREKGKKDKQRGHSRRHDGFNARWDQMSRKEQQATGANKRSVWTVATKPFGEAHFATFPPDLIKPCILAGCPEGGRVLDPFIGAGTTAIVAHLLKRRCIGIDLNETYLRDIAIPRIERECKQMRLVA